MAEYKRNIIEQYSKDMREYSIGVIVGRAIPDCIDGRQPVQRRIIYTLYHVHNMKPGTKNSTIKTARAVGSVLGLYHPHGNLSVENTIKLMVNAFDSNMPVLEGQGSFGSMYGDPASAARYTEIKINDFAKDVYLADLKECSSVCVYVPNYDNTEKEPVRLPARVPMLLVCGSYGIAVGLLSSIPFHNMVEVIDETIKRIKDPTHDVFLIPDSGSGADIVSTDFGEICRTGTGKYKSRAVIDVVEYKYSENNKYPALRVRNLPDGVSFKTIKSKIEEAMSNNKLPQIHDVLNNTKTDPLTNEEIFDAYIVLKRESDPNYVKEQLYSLTPLENTSVVNAVAITGTSNLIPMLMSYNDIIDQFIESRMIAKTTILSWHITTLDTECSKLDLYIRAMESGEIKNIQAMVYKQKTTVDKEIVDYIVKKLKVTPIQSKFLLDIDFKQLSLGHLQKYKEKYKNNKALLEECRKKLMDREVIRSMVIDELLYIRNKYGIPRRSKVIDASNISNIPDGEFKVVITENNFIKKVGINETIGSLGQDSAKFIIPINNRDEILLFNSVGKVFSYPVHKIPFAPRGNRGIEIRSMISGLTSDICVAFPKNALEAAKSGSQPLYIYTLSRDGYIKRIDANLFTDIPSKGLIYSRLDQGDMIVDVLVMTDSLDLIIHSNNKVLRISGVDVPCLGRATRGCIAMKSKYLIDGFNYLYPGGTHAIVVTEKGKVNKVSIDAIPLSSRGKAGSNIIKLSKNDKIKRILVVNQDTKLRFYSDKGTFFDCLASDIADGSSISPGYSLNGNGVVDVVKM